MLTHELKIIAHIETPYNDKFGVPRQSGMIEDVVSKIRFVKKYNNPDAIRGIDGFSYIWVIWGFSENPERDWTPTVRPPRLGGNKRMGVFATRSPNRPNSIGLSSLKLIKTELNNDQVCLWVSGADMVNGTPIYDIKPYIPFTDSHPDASFGFAEAYKDYKLQVIFPKNERGHMSDEEYLSVKKILSLDPRPSYQLDPNRVYCVILYGFELKFTVNGELLKVIDVKKVN